MLNDTKWQLFRDDLWRMSMNSFPDSSDLGFWFSSLIDTSGIVLDGFGLSTNLIRSQSRHGQNLISLRNHAVSIIEKILNIGLTLFRKHNLDMFGMITQSFWTIKLHLSRQHSDSLG